MPLRPHFKLAALLVLAHLGSGLLGCRQGAHQHVSVRQGECFTCHQAEYALARDPVHEGLFGTECGQCHSEQFWTPAVAIQHDWFPLRNAHGEAACSSCHTNGYDSGATPNQCRGCHSDDYESATAPPHDGYPMECAECHTDAGWRPSTFVHEWPLRGQHLLTNCAGCHGDPPVHLGTPTDCVSCHQAEYAAATAPPHAGYPTACAQCHDESGWRPSTFVHSFPLQGGHARTACSGCHGDPPVYDLPTNCVGCHQYDYDNATPSHATYPTDCLQCHSLETWRPAAFDHSFFPLEGAHSLATCTSCHGDPPTYRGTPSDCVSCHRDNYDNAVNPVHDGFPTDCAMCHAISAWRPSTFMHDAFPLEGAHANAYCSSCHGDPPTYAGLPQTCNGCHQADFDYATTVVSGHSGFARTCQDCHSTSAWTPASGGAHPENRFPISRGRHSGIACNRCHDTSLGSPVDGANTNCYQCHMDQDARHAGVRNYPTGANRPLNYCRNCHPTGNAG